MSIETGGSAVKKVHLVEVGSVEAESQRLALPEQVQLAMFEIAESAKEGLLALAVGAGLAVLQECMEYEVDRVVGAKGRHDHERTAKRHGRVGGEVTLGGRRVPISRPRVRSADDSAEVALASYAEFASRDLLERVALERMLARVSTRRYERAGDPVGAQVEAASRSTSRSAISRAFVNGTRAALDELLARDLAGLELAGMTHVVALGITTDGTKVPLSLREGSTENATVATALLADLCERGLRLHEQQLFVLDGAKALRKAVRDVAGARAPVQRCQRHKERNVLDHLPDRERPWVRAKLRKAWSEPDHVHALAALRALERAVERSHPDAAGSLREGLEETLTLTRLGVSGALKRTLRSTNPIESMIGTVRDTQHNVKRWRSGDMRMRWTAAGLAEAQRSFRRVKGHRDIPKLSAAIRHQQNPSPTKEAAALIAA